MQYVKDTAVTDATPTPPAASEDAAAQDEYRDRRLHKAAERGFVDEANATDTPAPTSFLRKQESPIQPTTGVARGDPCFRRDDNGGGSNGDVDENSHPP